MTSNARPSLICNSAARPASTTAVVGFAHCHALVTVDAHGNPYARLHESLGDTPPVEYEQQHADRGPTTLVGVAA